jgi:predicted MPP superfamily phosphohydrolase
MHLLAVVLLTAAALLGHAAITVWLFNRLHAMGWPRRAVKTLEKLLLLVAVGILLWLSVGPSSIPLTAYTVLCCLALVVAIPYWLLPKLLVRSPAALLSNDTRTIDITERLGFRPVHGSEAAFLAAIPGNELLKLTVQRKTIAIGNLPRELDGLTIAHLSDLHMTGQLGREFYDVIVDETNALTPDLIVITGDILEKAACLSWIMPTLGRLKARECKFFILGNHEQRLRDVQPLRRELTAASLIDMGGKCGQFTIRGTEVLIAGTERPWFGHDPEIPQSAIRNPHFRLLLSHTPDQLLFARHHEFDLMLAGHNHGGQIRLPYLGALITPSVYGCRYAGGLFFEPPTLLHVSRGLAGIHPIRLNCPPELPLLMLKCG